MSRGGDSRRTIYGVGPVRELLAVRADAIVAIHVEAGRAAARGNDPVAELVAEARTAGIAVTTATARELDALAGPDARHQGVVALARPLAYSSLDEVLASAAAFDEAPLIVLLDGVTDPHNLGAIIRSAYVLGAHGVVVPEHRAATVTPVVTKSSAGATELLPIVVVGNLVRALEELKAAGVWTTAVAAVGDARPMSEVDLRGPSALVLGAEGSGVRQLVTRTCDFHAVIPMARGGVGSLNVSVAAGVALYEVARQRAQ